MPRTITLTPDLRAEYERLYANATIRPDRAVVVAAVAKKIADGNHWPRYVAVAAGLGCPPHVVGLIHAMECGLDFGRHLHNGDPLTARTIHVPAGRPLAGKPPFAWETSAADALAMHGLDAWDDWTIPGLCYVLERYNGWGYRRQHPDVPTPYLWSMTTAYTSGKYVSDGTWAATAVSKQPGAVALLRSLADLGRPYVEAGNPASTRTPTAHPWPGTVLGVGASGQTVRDVQSRLLALGYAEVGTPDGLYGQHTAEAVRSLQASAVGLASDGRVGPATWAALWCEAPRA